jgi:hypothetical protein
MTYEIIDLEKGNKIIKRINDDGSISWIPFDEANSDYQRYLNPEVEQSIMKALHK